eukprot:637794-Lingulodinium_polyedra.AAC.1
MPRNPGARRAPGLANAGAGPIDGSPPSIPGQVQGPWPRRRWAGRARSGLGPPSGGRAAGPEAGWAPGCGWT